MNNIQNHDADINPPKVGQVLELSEQVTKKRESTRSYIALVYVVAYLGIVVAMLIIGAYKNYSIEDNKDMLLAISGILSGPLGFVIGYYFKADSEV